MALNNVSIENAHNVLFTQGDIYVRYDGTHLYRSMDGGTTFPTSIDVSAIDVIKNIHVFTDGTLNVFSHTKAYYSDNWETLSEATVLDENGDPYTFNTYDNFTVSRHNDAVVVVDNIEMYVFGNYCITDEYNQKKNIWYTIDKGHTYKSAYNFGLTSIRHVHNVYFNKYDSSFWITTGDSAAESKVIKGFYSSVSDSWTWETLATGSNFKWAGMSIYKEKPQMVYDINGDETHTFKDIAGNLAEFLFNLFSVDLTGEINIYYALDHTPGSVKKCKVNDVPTVSTHITLLANTPNDCINVIIDQDTGEMIVGLSIYGGSETTCRTLYYSEDRVTFESVIGEVPEYYPYSDTMYYGMYSPNNQKKILSGLWSRTHENLDAWDKVPSIWIDDIIRSKWPNAFKQS